MRFLLLVLGSRNQTNQRGSTQIGIKTTQRERLELIGEHPFRTDHTHSYCRQSDCRLRYKWRGVPRRITQACANPPLIRERAASALLRSTISSSAQTSLPKRIGFQAVPLKRTREGWVGSPPCGCPVTGVRLCAYEKRNKT